MRDALVVIAIAAAYSLLVGGLGALAVPALRRRSIGTALGAIVVITTLAVVVAVLGTAAGMFVSGYDVMVVLIAGAVATATGLAISGALARRIAGGTDALRGAVRDFARHGTFTAPATSTAELAGLSAELVRALDALEAAQRARRELVAGLSHDLRSPLAGVRAMAEALEDGVAPDPQRYHATIRRHADRLATMVDDLVALALHESGPTRPFAAHQVSLSAVARDAVAAAEAIATAAGVTVTVLDGPDVTLVGDPDELMRIAGNLVQNAVRHTPAGGRVTVEISVDADDAVLAVRDGCGGIPVQHLDRVFDLGWRGSPARTPDGGAGLGLAVVQAVARAHGGSATVDNVGGGCRFTVRVPRQQG